MANKKMEKEWASGRLLSAAPVVAAPIVGGTDYVPADTLQTVTLFPGTPLNPTTSSITFDQTAGGYFTVDRATQVGSTINFTIPSADFKGTLPSYLGSIPFDLEAGTPGINPSSGAITNVVQNPASPGYATGSPSNFVSGDFTADTYFELVLANGATIYSDPSTTAVFTAHVLGLPFPAGTTFTSPGTEKLYLQLGSSPNPNSDLLVGLSSNHFVTVTPEPSSMVLLGIGAAGMGISRWRRRKTSAGNAMGVRGSPLLKGVGQMKRAMLMMAALALLFYGAGQVAAGPILSTHARAGAFINLDNPYELPVVLEGNGTLDTGLIYKRVVQTPTQTIIGAARAVTNIQAQYFLKAYSSAVEGGYNLGQAMAAWRDVAFVNSMNHPAALRLNFIVDGTFAAMTPSGGYEWARASINITTTTNPSTYFQPSQGTDIYSPVPDYPTAAFGANIAPSGNFYADPNFWDSVSINGAAFHGTFHLDTPYNPNLGGYGWGLALYASSEVFNAGSATTDFLDTTSLQSVTLPDGTPISVTFDSGLQLNAQAVPEPTSLTLLGIGIAGFTGYGWWRRRLSAA